MSKNRKQCGLNFFMVKDKFYSYFSKFFLSSFDRFILDS